MKADDDAFVQQMDQTRLSLILTVDSNAAVPEWLRDDVCAQINAQANRIESYLLKNQTGLHAVEPRRTA